MSELLLFFPLSAIIIGKQMTSTFYCAKGLKSLQKRVKKSPEIASKKEPVDKRAGKIGVYLFRIPFTWQKV